MAKPRFTVSRIFLSIIIGAGVLLSLPYAANAEGPSCATHEFYGTVTNNGQAVGAGYVITAVVNGQQVASATTDTQGKWGVSQSFVVTDPTGSLIDFYVNGSLVRSAASCIETNQLNLDASGALPPSSAQPTVTSPAVTPSNSANSDVSGAQTSTASDPSCVITSPSTITFFIGAQPSATNSQPMTLIDCTLPGKETSFTLSNGVLLSNTQLDSAGSDVELNLAANTSISLNGGRQITVARLLSPPAAPPDSGLVAAYSFEPENSTFSPPAMLKLKYEKDKLPDGTEENSLYIAQLTDSGEWTALPSSLDTADESVSTQLSHFSTYGLLGKLPSKPATAVLPSVGSSGIVGPEADASVAENKPEAETEQATAAKEVAQQASGTDIFVLAVLIAGGILVVVLFAIIVRKRSDY